MKKSEIKIGERYAVGRPSVFRTTGNPADAYVRFHGEVAAVGVEHTIERTAGWLAGSKVKVKNGVRLIDCVFWNGDRMDSCIVQSHEVLFTMWERSDAIATRGGKLARAIEDAEQVVDVLEAMGFSAQVTTFNGAVKVQLDPEIAGALVNRLAETEEPA
jgi:hypothetical protein